MNKFRNESGWPASRLQMPPKKPRLTDAEETQAERRAAPRAQVVFETVRKQGEDELDRPSPALAWSGLAAGLSMGFSLLAIALIQSRLPAEPWAFLLSRAGYPLGFLIVVLGRQQLFTENTLTAVLPLLARRDRATALATLRLWGVVLTANLAGTFLFVLTLLGGGHFSEPVRAACVEIGRQAAAPGFAVILLRAVFAGWLIATMVWLMPFAGSSRVSVILIVTFVVGLGEFSHIVAGSAEVLCAALAGAVGWDRYFFTYLPATLAGNIVGGAALVAAINYAQVVAGEDAADA